MKVHVLPNSLFQKICWVRFIWNLFSLISLLSSINGIKTPYIKRLFGFVICCFCFWKPFLKQTIYFCSLVGCVCLFNWIGSSVLGFDFSKRFNFRGCDDFAMYFCFSKTWKSFVLPFMCAYNFATINIENRLYWATRVGHCFFVILVCISVHACRNQRSIYI